MSRYRQSLVEVFDAYGPDARGGLDAWANTDPEAWSDYVDSAAEKQYHADRAGYRRSHLRSAAREALAENAGQARLFEVPSTEEQVEIRRTLVLDGVEYDVGSLAGHDGAAVARKVAERDLVPALTSVNRCRFTLKLADHVDEETERLGRPVSFAEVLGWAA